MNATVERAKRPVQTVYYFVEAVVKINYAAHSNTAVLRAVDHMQLNHYGATVAEVFDNTTGTLHAVVTRSFELPGKIEIVFRREVQEGM